MWVARSSLSPENPPPPAGQKGGPGPETTFTTVSCFIDTNVFVYAVDDTDTAKRDRARAVVADPPAPIVISPQILGEFYVVTTRRLARPLDHDRARAAVEALQRFQVVGLDGALVDAAIRTSKEFQLSYWDGLVIETAVRGGCDLLLTEDLADGSTIRSVRIKNPFAEV